MVTQNPFRILIRITHLPTGQAFEFYKKYSLSGNEEMYINDLSGAIQFAPEKGLKLSNKDGEAMFIPATVCKDCVFVIITEKPLD